jgi:leucyl-tRNA synthetase
MISFTEPFSVLKNQGMLLGADHHKMSKSRGNVVTPDEMAEKYGVDALRLWVLFMGPFEAELEWNEDGIAGTYRFLRRLWNLFLDTADVKSGDPDESFARELRFQLARTVKKVSEDVDGFQFNTAVAALMEFVNFLSSARDRAGAAPELWRESLEKTLLILAPLAPFVAEELWHRLGFPGETIHGRGWPDWDDADLARATVELAVQVKGKIRGRIEVPVDASEQEIREAALGLERIREILRDDEPRKVIVVPGRLVNIIP